MSHELRTPLNSLLILAKLLSDNKDGNLSGKQVEYASTIYASGGDLLSLINEILDLSKVEAGKMQVEPRDVKLDDVREFCERSFQPLALQKGLQLEIKIDEHVPATINTDPQRLQQVLKNLLANAFKFTDKGGITLRARVAEKKFRKFENDVLLRARHVIAFEVEDTGIGIPKNKQKLIFEAFQQADGSTARKYGGTGLGLSISREIARLLGGEIHVESEPDHGSTFTLYLPDVYVGSEVVTNDGDEALESSSREPALGGAMGAPSANVLGPAPVLDVELAAKAAAPIEDDREHIRHGDRVLLIIEDDPKFARVLLQMAREKGFKGVVALRGDTGLSLANEMQPSAITLDLKLPVIDGWSILHRLKRNPRTRHIPVNVISVTDRHERGAAVHAFAYLEKPVSKEALEGAFQHIHAFLDRKVKKLLLVEDNAVERRAIVELVGGGQDVSVSAVESGAEALGMLDRETFDCAVVDLGLPDMDGFNLIEQVKTTPKWEQLPVVVYTSRDLTKREEQRLKKYAESIIGKAGDHPSERLLDATSLMLHRSDESLTPEMREMLHQVREPEPSLESRKVLVVDDDVRNIFAMTSVLESHKMNVAYAENGRAAIDALKNDPEIDIVLMDVMMPEMDGYETMRQIRTQPRFADLPIIAVTAKALKDDKEKCIAAGASDYLPKPIDPEKLTELIKMWLTK
jgi:CheY-like chemotaxis protein